MYGLVNKAVEEMVCMHHGEPAWERIKAQAGIDVDVFMSNEGYPDDVTYRLVGAASAVLGVPPSRFWRRSASTGCCTPPPTPMAA